MGHPDSPLSLGEKVLLADLYAADARLTKARQEIEAAQAQIRALQDSPRVPEERMRSALADANIWSDPAYGSPRHEYWAGMRDVLQVMLGITTEPPTLSSDNPAALLLLSGTSPEALPLPLFWTRWDWKNGDPITYGKDCSACGKSYETCTRNMLGSEGKPGKACCGTCGYTQTHSETTKRPR